MKSIQSIKYLALDQSTYGLMYLARAFICGLGEVAFAGDPTSLAHGNRYWIKMVYEFKKKASDTKILFKTWKPKELGTCLAPQWGPLWRYQYCLHWIFIRQVLTDRRPVLEFIGQPSSRSTFMLKIKANLKGQAAQTGEQQHKQIKWTDRQTDRQATKPILSLLRI